MIRRIDGGRSSAIWARTARRPGRSGAVLPEILKRAPQLRRPPARQERGRCARQLLRSIPQLAITHCAPERSSPRAGRARRGVRRAGSTVSGWHHQPPHERDGRSGPRRAGGLHHRTADRAALDGNAAVLRSRGRRSRPLAAETLRLLSDEPAGASSASGDAICTRAASTRPHHPRAPWGGEAAVRVAVLNESSRLLAAMRLYLRRSFRRLTLTRPRGRLLVGVWRPPEWRPDSPSRQQPIMVRGMRARRRARSRDLRGWQPDVILSQGFSDPGIEAQTLRIAGAVFVAHAYDGTCISGAKTFKIPDNGPVHAYVRLALPCELLPAAMRRPQPDHDGARVSPAVGAIRPAFQLRGHRDAVEPHAGGVRAPRLQGDMRRSAGARPGRDAERTRCRSRLACCSSAGWTSSKAERPLLDALPLARTLGRPLAITLVGDGPARASWNRPPARSKQREPALRVAFSSAGSIGRAWTRLSRPPTCSSCRASGRSRSASSASRPPAIAFRSRHTMWAGFPSGFGPASTGILRQPIRQRRPASPTPSRPAFATSDARSPSGGGGPDCRRVRLRRAHSRPH